MAERNRLENILEGVLFAYGEQLSVKKLSAITKKPAGEVASALENLKSSLAGRGIRLVSKGGAWQLTAEKSAAEYIAKLVKSELQEELTPAGLEVLALAAYRGPVSKAEIETVRGVNSAYALRNLTLRGLIEKNELSKPHTYEISLAALRKLGLEKAADLPQYGQLRKETEKVEQIISSRS